MKTIRTPRAALVGISGYGAIHLAELLRLSDEGRMKLTACTALGSDANSEQANDLRSRGCPVYQDYREMLAYHVGRLELCCLPTPISCHAPMTLAALAAGANVLVEKPLVASLEEAAAIEAAARRTQRFVAVGFQDLYVEENLELKRRLLTGAIGSIKEIRVCAAGPRALSYYRRNAWAGRIVADDARVLDSPLNNAFAHFVNLALFLAGSDFARSARPQRVQAELFRAQPIENFDTAAIHSETDTGVALKLYLTHSCETGVSPRLRIMGTSGEVHWMKDGQIIVRPVAGEEQLALPNALEARHRLFDRVLTRIDDPTQFICDVAVATEHVRLVELVQSAAPIRDVALSWCHDRPSNEPGDRQISIKGIESLLTSAFLQGLPLRQLNDSWAQSPESTISDQAAEV